MGTGEADTPGGTPSAGESFFLRSGLSARVPSQEGQTSEAIAVCRRASQELSLLDDEEGSAEIARDQMRMVWRSLEEEVKRGTADLGATKVLRNYIKAHWRFPASDPPSFEPSGEKSS